MLQTHSGDSPVKWTTPLSDNIKQSSSSSSPPLFLCTNLTVMDPPFASRVESSSGGLLTARASMNALLISRTESSVSKSQNDVSSSSSAEWSKNRVTEWDTKEMQPLESNTTIRSGMERRICSFLRSSRFSSLRSSMNIFLRLRLRWAERRLAARLACFLSSHSDMMSWMGGWGSASAAVADRGRRFELAAATICGCFFSGASGPALALLAFFDELLLGGINGTCTLGGGGMAIVEGDDWASLALACRAGEVIMTASRE
mmetsp:Transcript_41667/g.88768  ORF Transcript_41667/g.88768 Transcript_41667/m.88768 type:complete len:259 (+) Transcript_41667:462-1238(+)